MIEARIEVRRGGFRLRSDLCSEARSIGIWGPSGAGKSTFLQALAGLLRPGAARVVVDGVVLEDSAAGIRLPPQRRRIGLVFQQGLLFPHYDVRGNLRYGLDLLPVDQRRVSFERCVDILGLSPLLDRTVLGLSGGERQRVALGRAVLSSPRLLLCDEPLSSLDPARKAEIIPYLIDLRDALGIPVIHVSHDRDELERLCTSIVTIQDGVLGGEAAAS